MAENNILIVDDSRLIREAIAKILILCHVKKENISSVDQGIDAIDFFEFFGAQLVICGDNLGDMSALKALANIQQQAGSTTIKYLILSQNGSNITDINFLTAEQYLVLEKPFDKKALLAALLTLTGDNAYQVQEELPTVKPLDKPLSASPKKPTVLIVDDDPINIDVAAGILKDSYRVLVATSGAQALKVVHKNYQDIDLILLDIMMPEIDGYQVCTELKACDKTSSIPIFFLTAKSQVTDVTKGFSLGAVDYITKPIQSQILLARVATHVKLQQTSKQLSLQVETLKEHVKLREDVEKLTQHDLKGPLSSILFQAEKLADENQATSIKNAVNKVIAMINSSLDIFKIEQGSYPFSPENSDLTVIIQEAINACMIAAKDKDINIVSLGLDQVQLAHIEPLLCLSIFNNLIKNAVEASPPQKNVNVSLKPHGKYIHFTLSNEGIIPKRIRDNLFEKFVSSDHSLGSGLGTYSAKLLTEVQQGEISFDTLDETSTVFTVALPASKAI